MAKGRLLCLVTFMALLAGCYPEEWADVSPDGKSLVVSNKEGVFWLALDGTQAKRLSNAGWCPKFSPDGNSCVFTELIANGDEPGRSDLVLYNMRTQEKTVLRSWQYKQEGIFLIPTWKPDGKEVAYTVWRLVEKGGNNGAQQYTELHILDVTTKHDQLVRENVGLFCSWSPDGKKLAYTASEVPLGPLGEEMIQLGSLQIFEAGETQSAAGILFNPYAHLAWMNDDNLLMGAMGITLPVSEQDRDKMRETAYVVDLAAGTVKKIDLIEDMSWQKFSPCIRVSPTGNRFLFGTHASDGIGDGETTLWHYDFSTNKKTKLVQQNSEAYPFWIAEDMIGFFEDKNHIALAKLDAEGKVASRQSIDLTPVNDLPLLIAPKENAEDKPAEIMMREK